MGCIYLSLAGIICCDVSFPSEDSAYRTVNAEKSNWSPTSSSTVRCYKKAGKRCTKTAGLHRTAPISSARREAPKQHRSHLEKEPQVEDIGDTATGRAYTYQRVTVVY